MQSNIKWAKTKTQYQLIEILLKLIYLKSIHSNLFPLFGFKSTNLFRLAEQMQIF